MSAGVPKSPLSDCETIPEEITPPDGGNWSEPIQPLKESDWTVEREQENPSGSIALSGNYGMYDSILFITPKVKFGVRSLETEYMKLSYTSPCPDGHVKRVSKKVTTTKDNGRGSRPTGWNTFNSGWNGSINPKEWIGNV